MQVQNLVAATEEDMHEIWTWNAIVSTADQACLHNLVAEQAHVQPDAPAVCAWNGDLTYSELDELSTRLAYHLVE